MNYGMTILTKKGIKILRQAIPKRIMRHFTDTKTILRLIQKVNLPRRIIILNNGCIIKMKYPTG
jgi:hypothetical protein